MYIVFHMTPSGNPEQRQWDKWPELAKHLRWKYGAFITVVGSPKDRAYVKEFLTATRFEEGYISDMTGKTSLDDLIDLVRHCDLLVCVNSFVMHLGVALNKRMFAIVGATEPRVVLPPGIPHAYSLYARAISLETVIEGIDDLCRDSLRQP